MWLASQVGVVIEDDVAYDLIMGIHGIGAIFHKRSLTSICVLVLSGILIAGLWPFTFCPQNRVEWLQGENGIRFHGRGLVYGVEIGLGTFSHSQSGNSLTVEVWLKPEKEPDRNVPVFLTIYDPRNLEAVAIGQWRSGLIIRWKNLDSPLDFKEFGLGNALKAGERRLLTIVFDGSRTAVFLDGKLGGRYPSIPLAVLDNRWTRYVLGNSPNGRDSWAGDLFALALYNRVLSGDEVSRNYAGWMSSARPAIPAEQGLAGLYLFTEKRGEVATDQITRTYHIRVPRCFQPLHRKILIPPWKDFQFNRSYLMDMAVNLLGFIPFGIFYSVAFAEYLGLSTRRAMILSVAISAVLSLSIELMQAWIPLRDSQLMDVLMNISGTAVGCLLLAWAKHFRFLAHPASGPDGRA